MSSCSSGSGQRVAVAKLARAWRTTPSGEGSYVRQHVDGHDTSLFRRDKPGAETGRQEVINRCACWLVAASCALRPGQARRKREGSPAEAGRQPGGSRFRTRVHGLGLPRWCFRPGKPGGSEKAARRKREGSQRSRFRTRVHGSGLASAVATNWRLHLSLLGGIATSGEPIISLKLLRPGLPRR